MRLNWIQKVIFSVNAVVAALLVVMVYAHTIPPTESSFLYLLILGFPLVLVLNVAFVLWWVFSKKLHAFLSVGVLWLALPLTAQWFSFHISAGTPQPKDAKVMTFNVRLFNAFKWIDSPDIQQKIMAYIGQEDPDIIAFQEFYDHPAQGISVLATLKDLGYKYHRLEPRGKRKNKRPYFGLALFSKFPIVRHESGFLYTRDNVPVKNAYVVSELDINGKKLAIFNTHLRSLKFAKEDYNFVENATDQTDEKAIDQSKSILSKVLQAARERELEVMHLLAQIQVTEGPIMVTGDFNEPPTSFAYSTLIQKLTDPFHTYGFGLQPTFDGISTLPGLRLDNILHTTEITTTSYKTGPAHLSDTGK